MSAFLTILFVSIGLFFLATAGIGAIRLPDFYTRSHALGVMDTLGVLFVLAGLMFHFGLSLVTGKLLFVFIFIFIANPTVTHILMRAAYHAGLKPYTKKS